MCSPTLRSRCERGFSATATTRSPRRLITCCPQRTGSDPRLQLRVRNIGGYVNFQVERLDDYPHRRLTIKSSRDGASLVLEGTSEGREVGAYTAHLETAGLHAVTGVYMYGTDGLPDFFAELAGDWRGWQGQHGWSSLEGELSLDVEHDGMGVATTIVTLTPEVAPLQWEARMSLSLDAGALAEGATAVSRFFSPSPD